MGFRAAIGSCFRKYVGFQGRAPRSEFWWWELFTFLLNFVISFIFAFAAAFLISASKGSGAQGQAQDIATMVNLVGTLAKLVISLGLFLPGLAVTIRRLHDTDHSGWWCLIPLTVIGIIPFFIWMCSRGTPGANRFGLGARADIAGVFGDGVPAPTLRDQRI